MLELLISNFERKGVVLTAEEATKVELAFHHRRYRKHQYILQAGDIARYESFIISGLARKYDIDEKGQEHILLFLAEEWWAGDLYSFHTSKPAMYNIDCLEDTEVLQITRPELERLFREVPQLNVYFRILYQNAIMAYNTRLTSSLKKTAFERYQEFLQRYPRIGERIPNHQIASFLGITPQSLSRLRSQFASQGNS